MRVLLSTFGSRGDVQPLLALAVALQALGGNVRVCVPPDEEFKNLFATAGVELLPAFTSVREWVAEMLPKRATISLPKVAAQVMAAQYEAIRAAAEGCDVMMATGLFSSVAAARSVAEKLGMRYVYAAYCPMFIPSPYQRPMEYQDHPLPPDVTDNEALKGRCLVICRRFSMRARRLSMWALEVFRHRKTSLGWQLMSHVGKASHCHIERLGGACARG